MGKIGRPKGATNIATRAIKDIIDSQVDMGELVGKLIELADGVTVQKTDEAGETIIYTEKPDMYAAKILLEYRYGKPSQSVDVTSLGKQINSITVDIVEAGKPENTGK